MAGYADCLAGFISALGLERPHLAGLSFGGALGLEFCRRHRAIPRTVTLASAYAGWRGWLPADAAGQRLQQALMLADKPPRVFAEALLPTMFSAAAPREAVEEFGAAMLGFRPAGFWAMARASAEDLRDALPHVRVPALLVYGDHRREGAADRR